MRHLMGLIAVAAVLVGGCVSMYTLVPATPVSVAQSTMKVQPAALWNRAPKLPQDLPRQESWTRNGQLLDVVTFIGGVKAGETIVRQRTKDDRKVPVFRADMTPQDLVSLVESYYRIKMGATLFETKGVQPVTFLGKQGIQFDYSYISGDEVRRLGRSVMAIVDGKLYLMSLDGAALHYFPAALPEFEAMIASASMS